MGEFFKKPYELTAMVEDSIEQIRKRLELKSANTHLLGVFYQKLRVKDVPVKICCLGDSITYGTDNNSTTNVEPPSGLADDGTAHKATRAIIQYPSTMQSILREHYGDRVTVVNKGYSGDDVIKGLNRWNAEGDCVLMWYGHNDCFNDASTHKGDIKSFIIEYRKVIEKWLEANVGIILVTPSKIRVGSLDNQVANEEEQYRQSVIWLAKEYNIPVVEGDMLDKGLHKDFYSDSIHRTYLGYKNLGTRMASLFIGNGVMNPREVNSHDFLGANINFDSFKLNGGAVVSMSGSFPTANEIHTTAVRNGGQGFKLKNGDSVSFGVYIENDMTICVPSLYCSSATLSVDIILDENEEQGAVPNAWHYAQGTTINETLELPSKVTLVKGDLKTWNGVGHENECYNVGLITKSDKFLCICHKGWHTIKLSVSNIEAEKEFNFHGLSFIPHDSICR